MGVAFRQSVKTTIVVFSGAVLGTLVMWLSTRYLAKQQYGFTRNFVTYVVVLSQIFLLGLTSTLAVYVHRYPTGDKRKKVLITLCLLVPVAITLLATIPFFLVKSWLLKHFQPSDIALMSRYYALLPFYTILFVLQIILEQYLALQMKVAIAAFMREVVLRVANIVLILLFAGGYINFDKFMVGTVFVYVIPIIIYLFLAQRITDFSFSLQLSSFSRAEYKDLLHFSWYHFLLLLSTAIMGQLDAMAIPLYDHSGFEAVAVYGVAVFIMSFMQMPSKAMLMPTVTVLSQAIANDDMNKAKDVFNRSSINVLIATWFMAIIIVCNLDNVVVLLQKSYGDIIPLFLILFIGRFVDLATGLNDAVLTITKYYKFSFYSSVFTIGLLYILIRLFVPAYGVFGAAWASSITLVIFNLAKYIFVWKKLAMQPFSSKTLVVLLAGAPAVVAGYFIPKLHMASLTPFLNAIADAGIRSITISLIYIFMLLWLKPSTDIEAYLAGVKQSKRLF